MDKIYYSPQGYWKGKLAIKKLSQLAHVSEKTAFHWLQKQPIWQVYLPAPKHIKKPAFSETVPNDTHQIDLLFLPHDTINKKKYKYALTIVDVASRFKEAEPLTDKSSKSVAIALEKIYKRSPLHYPRLLQCDDGAEFKREVNQLYLKHNTLIRRGIPGVHRSQAVVEAFNKQLAERLFSYQYHQEMTYDERNREWVKRLPDVIRTMNREVHSKTKLTPVEAIQKDIIPSINKHIREKIIPLGTQVRYLYEPGEVEGDVKRRATDPIWSTTVYEIKRIVLNNPNVYYLRGGPKRSFVAKELQIIPQ